MEQISREKAQKEVDDNFEVFKEKFDEIRKNYPNKKFILLKNKKIIGGFDSEDDAEMTAKLLFKEINYFLQEVNPIPQAYEISTAICSVPSRVSFLNDTGGLRGCISEH